MLPNLPVESWLHIASLLPRGHVHKLAGLNWMLYSLAMDEAYEEVRFMDDGEDMLKTLHLLKYPNIASRVKRVYIRPGFFLEMAKPIRAVAMLGRAKSKVFRLTRKTKLLSFIESQDSTLTLAQCALANCSAVEDFAIVLHDLLPPPSFEPFLKTMWYSLGPSVRRLTIDATLAKFPLILQHSLSNVLPNLADLSLNLAVTRFLPTYENDLAALRAILCFTNTLRNTLKSLTLSSSGTDVSCILSDLRYFPCLQELSVAAPITTPFVFPYSHPFIQFLSRHKAMLQCITLGLPDAAGPRTESEFSYRGRVTREMCQLKFPVLRSLQIGIEREYWLSSVIILPLSPVKLPQLVSLTLLGTYMTHDDIEAVLGDAFDGNHVESLRLRVHDLSPRVLDTLAAALPYLTNLDITFKYRSVQDPFIQGSENSYDFDFEQQMKQCEYPDWMIQDLRISQVPWGACNQPHSHLQTMQIVARCLPLPVRLGIENNCICPDGAAAATKRIS